jgi:hypothetical protein
MLKAYDETARRLKELEATDHVVEYARLQQTIKGYVSTRAQPLGCL